MWQPSLIAAVEQLFIDNEAIRALVLVGSTAAGSADEASDVDFVCLVADAAVDQFFPTTAWLAPLGQCFAFEQSTAPARRVIRVCFSDFRRADFIFIPESALPSIHEWLYPKSQTRVLFSHDQGFDQLLAAAPETIDTAPHVSGQQFEAFGNQFWYKAVSAVHKIRRNDLLIGLHLALDLVRDCLVLAMMLRDKAGGTTVHRVGGPFNEMIQGIGLDDALRLTPGGIMRLILQATTAYDRLASHWSEDYQQRSPSFHIWAAAQVSDNAQG